MYIDETKSGLQNVFDLINTANGTSLAPGAGVQLSAPIAYAGPSGHNTKITTTGDPDLSYNGTQDLYYTRIGLDDNVSMPPVRYPITKSVTPAQFLDQVVAALKLVKTELQPFGVIAQNTPTLTLTPIANSLLYVGSLELALKWPVGQPYTFLLDTFTGSGALSAHTSDDGTHWWGMYGQPATPVVGTLTDGYLTQPVDEVWAYSDKTIPGEHTGVFKFDIVSAPEWSTLEFTTGSNRYNYRLIFEVRDDGKMYWSFFRKDVASQSIFGNAPWALGPQEARVVVMHDTTELWVNGVLRGTLNTQRYQDSNIFYFNIDNGSTPGALKVDSVTIESNDPMEEPPLNLWYGATRGSNTRTSVSQVVVNEKLWSCNGAYLQCFSCETGEMLSEIDLNAAFSMSGKLYALAAVDAKNNYLWLKSTNGFYANIPLIIRIDPAGNGGLGAVKDGLFTADSLNTSIEALTAGQYSDGIWAYRSQSGTKQIINLHPDTGAIVTSTAITTYGGGVDGMVFNGTSSHLIVSDIGVEGNRIRFFDTVSKTFEANSYTDKGPIGNGLGTSGIGGDFHLNFNDATGNYRWTKYQMGADPTVLLEVDIAHPEVPPNDDDVWIHGPVHVNDNLNEVMAIVERYDATLNVYPQELWAFDQDTLAFRRKVIPYALDRRVYDYCLDLGGNLYVEVLLSSGPRTSKLLRAYRT